jgi:hypothetical protein
MLWIRQHHRELELAVWVLWLLGNLVYWTVIR